MKDFLGNKLNIGDSIFFAHTIGQVVYGNITSFEGKKTIYVDYEDFIQCSPKLVKAGSGVVVNSSIVIKI